MKIPLISRLFKAAPVRKASDEPRSPLGTWSQQKRNVVEYSNVVAAHTALQHPIVFRALHKIASSVQQVNWYCEADSSLPSVEQAGAKAIKDINSLLKSPNDNLAPDQLRFWMALSYAVYGRIPIKVGVSAVTKTANGIYPLDPAYVTSELSERGIVTGYEYGPLTQRDKLPTRRIAESGDGGKAYAYEIYTPTLVGRNEPGKNITPLGAIGLPAEVCEMLLRRAYDTASGHPNTRYIITAEKTLTEKQKTAIKDHMENAGPEGEESGNILFLYNTSVEVHKLDNDLSDIHSKMPLDDMARMIYGAFGIPISLVGMGAADGAKFAGNYKESRQSFWEDTITPNYLTPIATGLTLALCPPGARIRFDLDTIDAIQDSRSGRASTLEKISFLTKDEKRELAGYPPLTAEQRAQLKTEMPVATLATTANEGG